VPVKQDIDSRLKDQEIRKRNWEKVGPHFKKFAIRWTVLWLIVFFVQIITIGDMRATSFSNALLGSANIVVFFLTLLPALAFWYAHLRWSSGKELF
jgi:hypothetical protein